VSGQGPDLVIAGAGGGLAGALRAAEQGLEVLVVEVSEHFRRGNSTSMSTAMVPGAGTRFQRADGIDDSPDRFFTDIMAKTHNEADQRLAGALTQVSARLVEWLVDSVGLDLHLVTDFHYPGAWPRPPTCPWARSPRSRRRPRPRRHEAAPVPTGSGALTSRRLCSHRMPP
jgi:fumarate reductase flavoprotein subunit